ncbi:hypothetical protein SAMN05421510_10042 [Nitrosomonas ureae]|uniref:Uncharacterized protein n=1 Tax=Nitrosomonas ureae TaxID=44577 RepID=A0A1H9AJV7_9PROT|nr:hypothetical protein SAMN05421510_10042 [Nitrosomonas ureae]
MKDEELIKLIFELVSLVLLCIGIVLSIYWRKWIWFLCLVAAVLQLLPKIFY